MKTYSFPAAAVVTVMLWAVSFGLACGADSTFNVDSYIPQKFTDFQLRLDGGIRIEGTRTDGWAISDPDFPAYTYDWSYDIQEGRGAIQAVYRYETIPRYWRLTIEAAQAAISRNGEDRYSTDWPPGGKRGLYPSADIGLYCLGRVFFSLIGKAGFNYGSNESDEGETFQSRQYSLDLNVAPGWGRLYEGQYAATGMYIIKELKNNDIMMRDLEYDEMLQLTELVYHYRRTHAIDSRLHKIEALSGIIDYLQRIGAADSVGPYGCLLIQDVWDYFPNLSRRFGFKVRVGGGWEYKYYSDDQTVESKSGGATISHYYQYHMKVTNRPYMNAIIEWGKPIGLHWQLSFQGEGKHYIKPFDKQTRHSTRYLPSPTLYSWSEYYWEYEADHSLGVESSVRYIFDSRTSASFVGQYDLRHYHVTIKESYMPSDSDIPRESDQRFDRRKLYLNAILEYRISVPTTLQISAAFLSFNSEEKRGTQRIDKEKTHSYQFTGRLTHNLF
jgi:hypothetical protein